MGDGGHLEIDGIADCVAPLCIYFLSLDGRLCGDVLAAAAGFSRVKGMAIVFVIIYSAFGFACERAPERMDRAIRSLTGEKPG